MLAAGAATERRIARGWQLAIGRPAVSKELSPLLALQRAAEQKFTTDTKSAESLGSTPELAALTVVANALLNLDAVLTR
jgi:hypothetical protein